MLIVLEKSQEATLKEYGRTKENRDVDWSSLLVKYLRHLWEKADGERQGQSKGSQTHQAVDGQDQPPMPLQEREPGGEEVQIMIALDE